MESNVTALERAFNLARSGKCRTVGDIRSRLKQEGYSDAQVIGSNLQKQLRAIIAQAEGTD
jgi:hypothetical protein